MRMCQEYIPLQHPTWSVLLEHHVFGQKQEEHQLHVRQAGIREAETGGTGVQVGDHRIQEDRDEDHRRRGQGTQGPDHHRRLIGKG